MAKKQENSSSRSGTPAGMRDALKKATTEMLVLFLLRQKPMYVYEMQQEIERITGGALTFNTLYLAIYRLQEHQYICESRQVIIGGRARTYFAPTESGLTYYRELREEYTLFTGIIGNVLAQDGKLYGEESGCLSGN